ncbi:hypothetical protein TSAR_005437 [Trichomalopsis sarcophagae]|uniref:Uncharacterized protein n=1 Tax=Trichomalopsis sarcophagae TaxID=543379 RepID=A0A232F995_9HYME|nr:hypothetical protein TSAR_005437 [Trichomalopsis sarcophagae]
MKVYALAALLVCCIAQKDAKGNTAAAQQYYENARQELSTACVRQGNTADTANVCSQKVVSWVFNVSLDVSSTARACLANI